MRECPTFAEFYRAVHGWAPFPWQERLAGLVASEGWPAEIGVPTGLGKTATIDIAVWALAAQAHRHPAERTAPTRIWYVVDRRLLVDTASDHVTSLATLLADSPHGRAADGEVLGAVGERLGSIGAVPRPQSPLFVSRLRGGTQLGIRPPDPSQPSVICATVAMYASRLLFRGYGTGQGMWPVDAALAGTDALVLLDEAHIAPALQRLIGLLPDCDASHAGLLRVPGTFRPDPQPPLPAPRTSPTLVALTATGDDPSRFDLNEADRSHPIVAKRLAAAKPTTLQATTVKKLASDLAAGALDGLGMLPAGSAAVVFVNRPALARDTRHQIDRQAQTRGVGVDVVTLTGQLRPPDAEAIRTRLLNPATGCPAGAKPSRDRHLIVVATQTLEVGADLDFDCCVSQSAGTRAITQRWGRLNRLGERPWATAMLLHPTDAEPSGLYGDEPAQLWERLTGNTETKLDLGPASIAGLLGPPHDSPGRIPELLPFHLWELAKTSSPPTGAAPPEVFFAGIDDSTLRVALLWRSTLPVSGAGLVPPPSDAETVDVPLGEARTFLADTDQWRRISGDLTRTDQPPPENIRPGDRIVIDAAAGGYTPQGWDPASRELVLDLSPSARRYLHLTAPSLTNLLGRDLNDEELDLLTALQPSPEDDPDPARDHDIAATLLMRLAQEPPPPTCPQGSWPFDQAFQSLQVDRVDPGDRHCLVSWASSSGGRPRLSIDALDELSIAPTVQLQNHLGAVGELAGRIAEALGLPDALREAAALAGRAHDLGKADPRFQRWLGNPTGDPVAKSDTEIGRWQQARTAAGWPLGARHELLSTQILDAAQQDGVDIPNSDLVHHLVISHHGHGRPTCPAVGAATLPTTVTFEGRPVAAHTNPGEADWNQPDRFRVLNERHGYWGLALLEAVVRQADHIVSAATEVQ